MVTPAKSRRARTARRPPRPPWRRVNGTNTRRSPAAQGGESRRSLVNRGRGPRGALAPRSAWCSRGQGRRAAEFHARACAARRRRSQAWPAPGRPGPGCTRDHLNFAPQDRKLRGVAKHLVSRVLAHRPFLRRKLPRLAQLLPPRAAPDGARRTAHDRVPVARAPGARDRAALGKLPLNVGVPLPQLIQRRWHGRDLVHRSLPLVGGRPAWTLRSDADRRAGRSTSSFRPSRRHLRSHPRGTTS